MAILVAIIVLAAIPAGYYIANRYRSADEEEFPETVELVLVREHLINTTSAGISYQADEPFPPTMEGIQDVHSVTFHPAPESNYTYKGQEFAWWEGSLAVNETFSVAVTYNVTLTTTRWNIDAEASRSVLSLPAYYDNSLGTEWLITPEDPEVANLSRDLVGGRTDVHDILRSIFDWMRKNVAYGAGGSMPKSCGETLADGWGDSDDQSILFAALVRAAGVPAWLQMGLLHHPDTGDWSRHAWNSVVIPLNRGGVEVVTVDVTRGHFLFRDPYRLTLWISTGDGEDLIDYYTAWSYRYFYTGTVPEVTQLETFEVRKMRAVGKVIY